MQWQCPKDSGAISSSIHPDLVSFILQHTTAQSKEVSFPVSPLLLKIKQASKPLTAVAVSSLTHSLGLAPLTLPNCV